MVSSRVLTASVGLLASLAVSAVAYLYFETLLVFLFVPFVLLLLGRGRERAAGETRECPACGFRTRDDEFDYCPRDGTRLE